MALRAITYAADLRRLKHFYVRVRSVHHCERVERRFTAPNKTMNVRLSRFIKPANIQFI